MTGDLRDFRTLLDRPDVDPVWVLWFAGDERPGLDVFAVDTMVDTSDATIGWSRRPKPWFDVWLTDSTIEPFVNEVIPMLTYDDIGAAAFMHTFATRRSPVNRPNLSLPQPDGSAWMFLFHILTVAENDDPGDARRAEKLERNDRLFALARDGYGGVRYPTGTMAFSADDWRRHYGSRSPTVLARRKKFDPSGIMTPGPRIFAQSLVRDLHLQKNWLSVMAGCRRFDRGIIAWMTNGHRPRSYRALVPDAGRGLKRTSPMPEVDEVADGIYRISTFVPRFGLTFNQFLIVDDQPLLFHTGHRRLFDETLAGVARLVEPAHLRWVSWSHLEADESGALNEFLEVSPMAEPVHSELGAGNVDDFAVRPTHTIEDGEALELGTHRLRFLLTPHVPHSWDALLAYEETTGTLFASDLLAQGGERPALTEADVVEPAVAVLREYPDVIPLGAHTFRVLDRLKALAPRTLAIHHGATFAGDVRRVLEDFHGELAHLSAISGVLQ